MKRFITSLIVALTLSGASLVAGPVVAHAQSVNFVAATASISQSKTDVCQGIGLTGGNCSDNGAGLNGVISSALSILSVVVGIAAVIMIILSGMRYITSGGEAQGVSSAKRTLIYALVGLVVVALAQTLVHFVLAKVG